jgi:hypothetical protein
MLTGSIFVVVVVALSAQKKALEHKKNIIVVNSDAK